MTDLQRRLLARWSRSPTPPSDKLYPGVTPAAAADVVLPHRAEAEVA
jgi:hypothetical protein